MYSWVDNPKGENGFEDLKEAFDAWGITDCREDAAYNDNGDFIVDGYSDNKWGQQEILLKAIAPYAKDIFIPVRGEDGEHWAWQITNGEFHERNGRIEYDE